MLPRFLFVALLCSLQPALADWPQFLGKQRNGHADAQEEVTDSLPPDGPKVVWKMPCGSGFAGPVVAGGVVYLFHRVDDDLRLDALNAITGKKLWSVSQPTNYEDSFGFDPGPRSCPTVDGGRVFCYGPDGRFMAVNTADGKLVWQRDLAKDLDIPQGFFGRASAPLVLGGKVLLGTGAQWEGKGAAAASFDAASGKLVWQAGRQDPGYASPVILDDKKTALFFLREGLLGVDTVQGREVFSVPFRAEMEASVNASTPIVLEGGKFFASASYGVGCGVWQWSGGALKNLWKTKDSLDCHYGTPVLHGRNLYGMHGRQETGMELRCLDIDTGAVKWKSGTMAAADLILVGKTLILVTDKGELILAKASPDSYQEMDRAQILTAGHRAPPAYSGGKLYVRDKQKLVALQLAPTDP